MVADNDVAPGSLKHKSHHCSVCLTFEGIQLSGDRCFKGKPVSKLVRLATMPMNAGSDTTAQPKGYLECHHSAKMTRLRGDLVGDSSHKVVVESQGDLSSAKDNMVETRNALFW